MSQSNSRDRPANSKKDLIFFGWKSKNSPSYIFAERLYLFFRSQFPDEANAGRFFFSEDGIEGGENPSMAIMKALSKCRLFLAFLCRDLMHDSGWMECEAFSARTNGARILPLAIDFPIEKMEGREWRPGGPVGDINGSTFHLDGNANQLQQIIDRIVAFAGLDSKTIIGFSSAVETLRKTLLLTKNASDKHLRKDIAKAFSDDSKFRAWIYDYHSIIHETRDGCVQFLNYEIPHRVLKEVPELLLRSELLVENENIQDPAEARAHPLLQSILVKSTLGKILGKIEAVFRKLFQGPEAPRIWACIRDLRVISTTLADSSPVVTAGYYHLVGSPECPPGSRPAWSEDHECIKTIRGVLEGNKSENTPRYERTGNRCSKVFKWDQNLTARQETLLGAVLLKRSIRLTDDPGNSGLWCILSVTSDQAGTFNDTHEVIIQGFNDAISTYLNVAFFSDHYWRDTYSPDHDQEGEH